MFLKLLDDANILLAQCFRQISNHEQKMPSHPDGGAEQVQEQ
jgi:hypothetical protein